MFKRWIMSEKLTEDEENFKKNISNDIKCPAIISELLLRKGMTNIDKIKKFLKPSLEQVHDPFLFPDMEKAVDRIIAAVNAGEKITIYGDYDVDGTTSTALLYLGLKKLNADINYYIPHRMIDGYGLSITGVEHIAEMGTSLIITVDCGVNAIEEVNKINSLGIDIIITDHHNPKEVLPSAIAIINPKLKNCKYPFHHLAGVGVAYKLLVAVFTKLDVEHKEWITKYIDLVALGTIADIVPLIDENRVFSSFGLERLFKKKNIGLSSLMNIAGISDKELNSGDIVFGIAPRINAAGRMGSAERAVELLIATDETRSMELAEIIERENSLRQQIDQRTFSEACEIIENKYKNIDETPCFVVSSDNWHPGVIGIVASRIVEKYYRPTIMISFKDGIGHGSGRSIADFDLFEALLSVNEYLESFGGHKYAAGLSIFAEYLDSFENKLAKFAKSHITEEQLIPPLKIDTHIELYDINEILLEWLEKFTPYGPANMRPVFLTENVIIVGYPYSVGKNHLKIKIMKDGCTLDCIGFNLGDYLPLLKKGLRIDVAYSLEFNTWHNRTTIQARLKDLRLRRF